MRQTRSAFIAGAASTLAACGGLPAMRQAPYSSMQRAARDIEPVPEGNVFFAGEQTSYEDMGYINGAIISGERAARQIARA